MALRFFFMCCLLCSSPLWALQLQVETVAENAPARLRVGTGTGAIAVSSPREKELWIVGAGKQLDTPSQQELKRLGIEKMVPLAVAPVEASVDSVYGVALHFSRPFPWHVVAEKQEKARSFILQRGNEIFAPEVSLVHLKDELFLTQTSQDPSTIWQVRHPETGQVLNMIALEKRVPKLVFAEQGAFQNLWGISWDASDFLVAPPQTSVSSDMLTLYWQRNPTAMPKAEVMMSALPQLDGASVSTDMFNDGKSPAVLAWGRAEDIVLKQQIPDYIKKPYHAGEALPFTPLRPKTDPASLERAFKFADAASALRTALEKVEQVQPSGVRDAGAFQPFDVAILKKTAQKENSKMPVDEEKPASVLDRGDAFLIATKAEKGNRFREQEADAIYKLGQAGENPVLRDEAITNLARIYLNFQRPRQAWITLQQTVLDEKGYPVSAMARTLLGAAQVLDGKGEQAIETLKRGIEPHRMLWQAAALAAVGRLEEVDYSVEEHMPVVQVLPKYMQTFLYKIEAERLFSQQQYSGLEDFIDRISTLQYEGQTPRELNYVLARSNLELGNTERGRELLSAVAQMPLDGSMASRSDELAVQAKFDFLRDLARTGDIGPKQEILFLEDLQFDWRGDETEGAILQRLGALYAGTRQYRSALDHLKTYAVAFPDSEDIDKVTEGMRDTFVSVFQPENRDLLDRLGVLGMYYDFRELTPADLRGDYVVETVAQELNTALLYRRAADLFENQLTYRLTDDNEKVAMAAELAALYRKSLDPNLAMATLQAYKPENVRYDVKRVWDLEAARVYLALNQPETARDYVANYVDDYAQDILVDIAWSQEDYETIARALSLRYDTAEHEGFESIRVRSDFIRLAYALVQLEQKDALAQLVTNYKEQMKTYPEVADIVNVYATQLKLGEDVLPLILGRPLQKIAQKLIDMNTFEAMYNETLMTRQERQNKRQEYNSKMRYMEFLEGEGLI